MSQLPRRRFLWMMLTTPIAAFIAACRGDQTTTAPTGSPTTISQAPATNVSATSAPASTGAATDSPTAISEVQTTLEPTPACDDGDEETIAQTEGPFYTPNNPE